MVLQFYQAAFTYYGDISVFGLYFSGPGIISGDLAFLSGPEFMMTDLECSFIVILYFPGPGEHVSSSKTL